MQFDWRHDPCPLLGHLMNLDTGQPIPFVFWLDDETGDFLAYQTRDGKLYYDPESNSVPTWRGRARFRFVAACSEKDCRFPATRYVVAAPDGGLTDRRQYCRLHAPAGAHRFGLDDLPKTVEVLREIDGRPT